MFCVGLTILTQYRLHAGAELCQQVGAVLMNMAFSDGISEVARDQLMEFGLLDRVTSMLEFGNTAAKFVGMGILTNMSIDNERRKNDMLRVGGVTDAIARSSKPHMIPSLPFRKMAPKGHPSKGNPPKKIEMRF